MSHDRSARYPSGPGPYPAAGHYPEFADETDSQPSQNLAFALVRRSLAEYGCDSARAGTSGWNPLSDWIPRGARVFVQPNLVLHRRRWESPSQFEAQVTHGSILRAVLDYALLAAGDSGTIRFGNAPLQGANFDRAAGEAGLLALGRYYHRRGAPVEGPIDLRTEEPEGRGDRGIRIDLGRDSLLESLRGRNDGAPVLRAGVYHPGHTASYHRSGSHTYLVHRHLLESDVIIAIPKLKTHCKVGLTCALKGAVGTVTYKACLAHFREGSPEDGGDEFPAATAAARAAASLKLLASHAGNARPGRLLKQAIRVGIRTARVMPNCVIGGEWSGNDTCWRMALDLNRILLYGRPDGTMSDTPQRRYLVVVDGVIAGEGDGPLHATPRRAGIVLFGADPPAVDAGCAYAMNIDPRLVPLLRESFAPHRYALTPDGLERLEILLNGHPAAPDDLANLIDPPPRVPRDWQGTCEYQRTSALGSSAGS